MHIPRSGLEKFVRQVADQCLVSQQERLQRGLFYRNYALYGAENADGAAIYNKTFAYLDDLQSLLYSPISLRFHIGDPDLPNVLEEAKGRAASAKLRTMARRSDTDTEISDAVFWSLVKGKAFIKQSFKRDQFSPTLVQPESMGVMNENHSKLDSNMEAFMHSMLITPYQLSRLLWNHPEKESLARKAKRHMQVVRDNDMQAGKQVIVGGLYPFQPAGGQPSRIRGIVDWMGGPSPMLDSNVQRSLLRLDEVWIWDDRREDWSTFQIIGDDILIFGKIQTVNAMAYNTASGTEVPELKGKHPFLEFCPNRLDGYFWGRSEIVNVALLQEAINSRINGINRLLRKQEDPPTKFVGSTGVNQNALARFNKPGGYWVDQNPNAKIDQVVPTIPGDLWESLAEYERMFDEMGGLPPIAKGRGEAGVRSQGHAETLVRMFSPRFKDRALLVERDVEACGALMLDLAKAHVDTKLTAWVPEQQAGMEKAEPNPLLMAPAPGLVPVNFLFSDVSDESTLTVDSHSSSPAFSADSRALVFDLFKIGAMSAEQVVDHVDAPDPEELIAGVQRRAAEKAAAIKELEDKDPRAALKALQGGKH